MKRKWMSALYCGTYFLACVGFAGCQSKEVIQDSEQLSYQDTIKQVSNQSSVVTGASIEDSQTMTQREISLEGLEPKQFLYNYVDNIPALIVQSKNTYTLYTLGKKNTWEKISSWKCKSSQTLDTFTYSPDGTLYCVCKQYEQNKQFKQKLMVGQKVFRCKKDGSMQEIKLQKIGLKEICDIRFAGTALAVTHADHSVVFYNILEKRALGDDSVRGEPGVNIFYDHCYFSLMNSPSGECLLADYDMRTGTILKTFALGDASVSAQEIKITNYHEKMYVLTPSGLYTGLYTDNALLNQAGLAELKLADLGRVKYFQAARDDVIYYAKEEDNGKLRYMKVNILEKKKDSVFIMAKL